MCNWACSVGGDTMASSLSVVTMHVVSVFRAWFNWHHVTAVKMRVRVIQGGGGLGLWLGSFFQRHQ